MNKLWESGEEDIKEAKFSFEVPTECMIHLLSYFLCPIGCYHIHPPAWRARLTWPSSQLLGSRAELHLSSGYLDLGIITFGSK